MYVHVRQCTELNRYDYLDHTYRVACKERITGLGFTEFRTQTAIAIAIRPAMTRSSHYWLFEPRPS